jgi:hypothetical protein
MPELSGFRKLMSAAVEWAASAEHITGICFSESTVSPGSLHVRLRIKNRSHWRDIPADMENASEEVIANQIKIQLDELLSYLVEDIPRREASSGPFDIGSRSDA